VKYIDDDDNDLKSWLCRF